MRNLDLCGSRHGSNLVRSVIFRKFVVDLLVVKVLPAAIRIFGIQEPRFLDARISLQLPHDSVKAGVLEKIHKPFAGSSQDIGIGLSKDAGENTLFSEPDLLRSWIVRQLWRGDNIVDRNHITLRN